MRYPQLFLTLAAAVLAFAACGGDPPSEPTPPPPPPPPPGAAPGRYLAWTSTRDGNAEIYAASIVLDDHQNITNHPAQDHSPAFLRNSTKIAFVSDRDGNKEIYSQDLSTGTLTRLTFNSVPDDMPAWSGDGTKLAFVREVAPGHTQIFVMNANGTGQTNISNTPRSDTQPNWRPTQNQLVFASDRDAKYGPGTYLEVYRMNGDGTGVTRLTFNDDGIDYYPTWSPDGVQIAFTTHRPGLTQCYGFALEIFVMESDGSGQRNVTTSCRGDAGATWVRSDRLVVMSDRGNQAQYAWDLYRVDLLDGAAVRLTTTGKESGPSGR